MPSPKKLVRKLLGVRNGEVATARWSARFTDLVEVHDATTT
jgi:hypothetical protein